MRIGRAIFIVIAGVILLGGSVLPTDAGQMNLTIVNIQTPQGVKIWVPQSVHAKRGDTVTLKLINKLDKEHGYEIAAFGVKEVVGPKSSKTVSFRANRAGIFPIKCQLHIPHVAGQLVVHK